MTGVLTDIDFGGVGRLSDYRTSLFLKGERLFHTKNTRLFDGSSQENATTIGYDYSNRNATTIARSYWLSGESPKKMRREPPTVPRRPPLALYRWRR